MLLASFPRKSRPLLVLFCSCFCIHAEASAPLSLVSGIVDTVGNNFTSHDTGDPQFETATSRLTIVLFKTAVAIGLGYVVVHLGYVEPDKGHLWGIRFYVGKIALPLLVFQVVATARLDNIFWGVVLASNVTKAIAYLVAIGITLVAFRGRADALAVAAVYGFFVVASDDFAIGFPVITALYPERQSLDTYLTINALCVMLVFIPVTLVLLETGKGIAVLNYEEMRNIASGVLCNPIIFMTVVGLLWQFVVPPVEEDGSHHLNEPLRSVVQLLASPFSMLALFLTGSSLGHLKFSPWPVFLVLLKVIFCSYVAQSLCALLVETEPDSAKQSNESQSKSGFFLNYAFLYGSIPTSSAPLVFAVSAGLSMETQAVIASAIVMGLLVAGPSLLISSVLFENRVNHLSYALQDTLVLLDYIAVPCLCILFAIFVADWRFFTKPPMDLVMAYAIATALYLVCKDFLLFTDCKHFTATPMRNRYDNSPDYFFLPDGAAVLFGFLQNLCRLIILVLLWWRIQGFPRRGTRVAIMTIIVVACLIGSVTPPNTLNEVCDLPVTFHSLSRTLAVVFAFFLVLSILFFKQLLGHDNDVESEGLLDSPGRSPRVPRPDGTTICLAIGLGLRLLMELCMCSTVALFGKSMGDTSGFQQMLIFEHVLEHTQAPLLLFAILLNEEYVGVLQKQFDAVHDYILADEGMDWHGTTDPHIIERETSP